MSLAWQRETVKATSIEGEWIKMQGKGREGRRDGGRGSVAS